MKKANLTLYDHLLMYTPSNSKRRPYRSTQVIATIPQNADKDRIHEMIEAGMNIACFAVEGSDYEEKVMKSLNELKAALDEYNKARKQDADQQEKQTGIKVPDIKIHVATALDIHAEPILTGSFINDFTIGLDQDVKLTSDKTMATSDTCISIDCNDLGSLPIHQVIVIAGETGKIKILVNKLGLNQNSMPEIDGKVIKEGTVRKDKKYKVYFPGAKIKVAGINVAEYCNFCKKNEIDMIMVPVSSATVFKQIACIAGADNSAVKLKVIAKLEGQEAVQNIDKLVEHANGVMLSRINLGEAVQSPEQVIVYQKNVIAKCLKAGITSIVANHILKGMEANRFGNIGEPTRAEYSDLINAVLDGADCAMLDEKTSQRETIETMCSVIMEAEDMINYRRLYRELVSQATIPQDTYDFSETIAIAACTAALVNTASAIIVLTDSGKTALKISKYRPECPIIAVTKQAVVARQCLMARGVFSIVYENPSDDFDKSIDDQIQLGIAFAKMTCLIKKLPGVVVAVLGARKESRKVDAMKVITVEKEKKEDKKLEDDA